MSTDHEHEQSGEHTHEHDSEFPHTHTTVSGGSWVRAGHAPGTFLNGPTTSESPWPDRHASVRHFEPLFDWEHLPTHLQNVSMRFAFLARELLTMLRDGPELTVCLRKLLEAKDAAVRQAVLDRRKAERSES